MTISLPRKRSLFGLALLACSVSSPAWAAPSLLQQAQAARAAGHFDQADTLFHRAVQEAPRDPRAWAALGDMQDYLGLYQDSLKDYRQAAQLAPGELLYQAMIGQELNYVGEYDSAYRRATRLLGLHPTNPHTLSTVYLDLAAAQGFKAQNEGFFAMIKYGLGVKGNISHAIEADPRSPAAQYAMGRFYLGAPSMVGGDIHKSLGYFYQAYTLNPASYENRAYYIRALLANHQDAMAREELQRYQQLFATIPHAEKLVAPVKNKL